ncbi:hypothetical protein VTN77DRAFT_6821 [Rasamsonia byssochlamydoides]|uniref:uncharacterized protein n=1 Tax=Rasamsonia byssochlamydoides TaxID=89139 RepID=UPI0037424600
MEVLSSSPQTPTASPLKRLKTPSPEQNVAVKDSLFSPSKKRPTASPAAKRYGLQNNAVAESSGTGTSPRLTSDNHSTISYPCRHVILEFSLVENAEAASQAYCETATM